MTQFDRSVIEEFRNMAVLCGYEVTLPGGNVLIYGLEDKSLVDCFIETFGEDAVELVYKFKKDQADPAQTNLFESRAS